MSGIVLSKSDEEKWGLLEIEKLAIEEAKKSTCIKSQRGVVVFDYRGIILSKGHIVVTAEELCSPCIRENINDNSRAELCSGIHAEQVGLIKALSTGRIIQGAMMMQIKVKNGQFAFSGPPSCTVCSRLLYLAGVNLILHHKEGFVLYGPAKLNRLSFEYFLKGIK